MLWSRFNERFDDLLAAWREHERLRGNGAGVGELARSRLRLDLLRREVNTIRRAFAPEPRERTEAAYASYCPTYEQSVFLYPTDRSYDERGQFGLRCVCGGVVAPDLPVTGH